MAQNSDSTIPDLLNLILLIDDAIGFAEKGLLSNPSIEEDRSLDRALITLRTNRSALDAKLDAALGANQVVMGPTAAQSAQIETLTDEVEKATNKNASVNDSLTLIGKVLDLAGTIVART